MLRTALHKTACDSRRSCARSSAWQRRRRQESFATSLLLLAKILVDRPLTVQEGAEVKVSDS